MRFVIQRQAHLHGSEWRSRKLLFLLNDFRWNPAIIAWADFLQVLEGDFVHLPAPEMIWVVKIFCSITISTYNSISSVPHTLNSVIYNIDT